MRKATILLTNRELRHVERIIKEEDFTMEIITSYHVEELGHNRVQLEYSNGNEMFRLGRKLQELC